MGKLVTEKLRDSEVLEVRVLDPARADPFVRQILDVLEEKQPHHEAHWGAGAAMLAKQRGEFIIDPVPIDLPSQAHQLVLHVDNLVRAASGTGRPYRSSLAYWATSHPSIRCSQRITVRGL